MEAQEDPVPCEDFPTCGVAQFQNRQFPKNVKQQDSYFVVEDVGATFGVHLGRSDKVGIYGVADGHGEFGEISAGFIRRNFTPQLAQSPHFAAGRLVEAFLDAFAKTEVLQQSAGLPLWASGACVTVAAVSPTHIVVANCGDCRTVLADQGGARDLSNDHNVESASPEEIQRVLNSGGTIMPDKRVTVAGAPGRLATTRSLGDYWAKPQGPPENHVISGLPEIRTVPRLPSNQQLIICSDGIFGFMSSQETVSLSLSAAQKVTAASPLSRIAHTVVCTAVNGRRSDDNCTCLVVDLSRIEAARVEGRQNQAASRSPSPMPRGPPLHDMQAGPPNGRPLSPAPDLFNHFRPGGYQNHPPLEVSAVECPGCGHHFTDDAAFCKKCGQRRPEVPMSCLTCGCIYSSDASFCKQCGTRRIGAPPSPMPAPANAFPPVPMPNAAGFGSPMPNPAGFGVAGGGFRGDPSYDEAPKDDLDDSLSDLVAPDEVCWCPICWTQNREGEPENIVLGSFEKWRQHMHDQHFDKLGRHYAADEILPCYWCCRPCATKRGQNKPGNSLAFWGSHERVCRENPNKPTHLGGARSVVAESSHSSSQVSGPRGGSGMAEPPGSRERELREFKALQRGLANGGGGGGGGPAVSDRGSALNFSRSRADSPQAHRPASPIADRASSIRGGGGGNSYQVPRSPLGGGLGGRAPLPPRDEQQQICRCGTFFVEETQEFCRKCGESRNLLPSNLPGAGGARQSESRAPPSSLGDSRAPARRAL